MNLITWIFYILQKVIIIPMGSVREVKETNEQAVEWYKSLGKDNEDVKIVKEEYLEFWGVKLFLLISSIFLIPTLRDYYNGKVQNEQVFEEEEQ